MRALFLSGWLLLLCILSASAQDTLITNALLWRISGKGLPQPSYLFGTIHRSDPRLFRFTDSFYAAFDATKAYAMEVHPQEFGMAMGMFLSDTTGNPPIRADISEADYWDVGAEVARKVGVPIQMLHRKHAWYFERVQMVYAPGPNDLRYNLDFYLYRIARGQGWWTGGVETPGEHLQVTLDDWAAYKADARRIRKALRDTASKPSDTLLGQYLQEDLASIYRGMQHVDSAWMERVNLKRNRVMTLRIDSLAQVRPTFFAVGVAHLPGCKGVVTLLKEAGYTMTPVLSAHRIAPEAHPYRPREPDWQPALSPDSMFSVQMPDTARRIGWPGQAAAAYVCSDNTGITYSVTALPSYLGTQLNAVKNRLTDYLAGRAMLDGQPKRVSIGKIKAWEFREHFQGIWRRRLLVGYDGHIVELTVAGQWPEELETPNVTRFFNSLVPR